MLAHIVIIKLNILHVNKNKKRCNSCMISSLSNECSIYVVKNGIHTLGTSLIHFQCYTDILSPNRWDRHL